MAKLVVGDKHVCPHADAAHTVRFFLLDGSPWYVHTRPDGTPKGSGFKTYDEISLFIEGLTGRVKTVYISQDATMLSLYKEVAQVTEQPVEELRLVYGGTQLNCDDEVRISDEKVQHGSTVSALKKFRGVGSLPGVLYTDITSDSGTQEMKWSDHAPKWRTAKPGLCIEGICTNSNCDANDKVVIVNHGYSDFDLINDVHTRKCPVCLRYVESVTFAFNNCKWKIVGRKHDNLITNSPEMFSTDWKTVGNVYERFSPEKSGMGDSLDLKVLVGQRFPICAVCASSKGEMQTAKCGHAFHTGKCADAAIREPEDCIGCVSRRGMTVFQKQFA